MRLARREIVLGASVGVALSTSKTRADDLIRDADLAMSGAKAQGKRQIRLFEPTMHRELLDRLTLEGDLRRAVRAGELRLAYQPIVDLESGRIVSVESLARWDHATLGAVPPSRFIPLAEQTGLIIQLGRWALEESCRQVAEWDARAPGLAGIGISVNVSAYQLADPGFIEAVEIALERSGIEAGRLSIELTESSLIGDGRHTDIALERLRSLGVGLQVDDLGTGYSTLSNLTRIPISGLKIDRMFISPVAHSNKDAAVVSAVIAFGRSLDLAVIAEGIETPEQLERLRELGCEFGQGYLLARPETPAGLEARHGAVAA
jgi:EAL domain-containing protein (putative c-di-GMP-specific phosphodiesterase class I)